MALVPAALKSLCGHRYRLANGVGDGQTGPHGQLGQIRVADELRIPHRADGVQHIAAGTVDHRLTLPDNYLDVLPVAQQGGGVGGAGVGGQVYEGIHRPARHPQGVRRRQRPAEDDGRLRRRVQRAVVVGRSAAGTKV